MYQGPTQEGDRRGQELGRAMDPSGWPLAALWPPFGTRKASGTLIFNIIFPEFFRHFKQPENLKKQQKTGTGNWVH